MNEAFVENSSHLLCYSRHCQAIFLQCMHKGCNPTEWSDTVAVAQGGTIHDFERSHRELNRVFVMDVESCSGGASSCSFDVGEIKTCKNKVQKVISVGFFCKLYSKLNCEHCTVNCTKS